MCASRTTTSMRAICRAVKVCIIDTETMICDLCNSEISGNPACLLGTKDVVTSKDCWTIYFKSLIADRVTNLHCLSDSVQVYLGQMASSDTPWALCWSCKTSLSQSGLQLNLTSKDLPPSGHAICATTGAMQFKILDDDAMLKAFTAANTAAQELTAAN